MTAECERSLSSWITNCKSRRARRNWLARRQLTDMARLRWIGWLLAAMTMLAEPARAHDIPVDAVVRMFVKPQGLVLRVLVRMPLKCISDAEYPRRERDFVDLAQVDVAR